MKKTMFITSVIMVVVLAIALTTSSLAWFSAAGATSVGFTQLTIAATASVADSGLEISNNGTVWTTNSINFHNATEITTLVDDDDDENTPAVSVGTGAYRANGTLDPMCPVGDMTKDDAQKWNDIDLFKAVNNMKTAVTYIERDGEGEGVETFKGNPSANTAFIDTFYLHNSGEADCNVSINITAVAVENRSYDATLWIAIFDVTGVNFAQNSYDVPAADEAKVKLLAIRNSTTNSGSINPAGFTWTSDVANMGDTQPVFNTKLNKADFAEKTLTLVGGSYNGDQFEAGAAHKLMIYAWFDGSELDNSNSNGSVRFSLTFGVANS